MTNYDTEIRRIADEVRQILNNCTDAPRLLREYAGLYTEGDVTSITDELESRLQHTIGDLEDELSDLRREVSTAEDAAADAESRADRLDGELEAAEDRIDQLEEELTDLRTELANNLD